jgi:predicted glycoside hydrolase/deacetylase ChbG (UPF0249 family)
MVPAAEIEQEFSAQIERLLAAGIQPSHLDTHQHTHLYPAILRALAKTAQNYKIAWLRRPFDSIDLPFRCGNPKRRLLAGSLKFLAGAFDRTAGAFGLRWPDHFTGFVLTGRLNRDSLMETLQRLPSGSTELMCHPGYSDEVLTRSATNLLAQRRIELETLRDPQTLATIRDMRVQLISFRELPARTAVAESPERSHPVAEHVAAGHTK